MNKRNYELNESEILEWHKMPNINPKTKRKIKTNGPVYKKLKKCYDNYIKNSSEEDKNDLIIDKYITYRRNKVDPLSLLELPLLENKKEKDLFKFEYKWNPYTGERLGKDENGPLWFDPDTLIHYLYIYRLRGLWTAGHYEIDNQTDENIWYQGMYGDCVGTGPDFINLSRGGERPEKYLFRLPIPDNYLPENHFGQAITMGPVLNENEIREIQKLAKRYGNNYEIRFKRKRPSLIQIKKWYDIAISKTPEKYTSYTIDGLEGDILATIREEINRNFVDLLIKY
jgi:hypothetical protein